MYLLYVQKYPPNPFFDFPADVSLRFLFLISDVLFSSFATVGEGGRVVSSGFLFEGGVVILAPKLEAVAAASSFSNGSVDSTC